MLKFSLVLQVVAWKFVDQMQPKFTTEELRVAKRLHIFDLDDLVQAIQPFLDRPQ